MRGVWRRLVGDPRAPLGLVVIGAMVVGKASGRIFIENGRFHGQVVIDEIARRQR